MFENASLSRLLQNSKYSSSILCGRFLPDNNNVAFTDSNNVSAVAVLDNAETKPPTVVAFGAIHLYANNQAYLMFCECDPKYAAKSVAIERCDQNGCYLKMDKSRQRCFKISSVFEKDFDYSGLPDYFGAFEDRIQQHLLVHVYDQLVNASVKASNMDLCKNITIDLYDTELVTETERRLYRDQMGLIVTDKSRYFEIIIKKSDLRAITANKRKRNAEVTYEELSLENQCYFFDYDSVVTFMNRRDYLDFLYNMNGMSGTVAIEKQQPVGYALALSSQVVQCYADSPEIACGLIDELIYKMSERIPVVMFMRQCDDWICNELLDKARQVRRIHRFHSRMLPARVKWENVFLMNIGAHIF